MEIRQNLTETNYNARGTIPKWIVIHNTANGTSTEGTAYNNTKYFKNRFVSGAPESSAHYFVDDGDTVWQCVQDTDTAWHVGEAESRNGCYNTNSIGIEVCETAGGWFTDHEVGILQELVPMLMDKYGIDADHVCRHHDVTGKSCPWYYVDDARWAELKARILSSEIRRSDLPMEFIIHPDEASSMFYVSGTDIIPLAHPDDVKALQKAAAECGTELPVFAMGTPDAPWGFRLFEALGHVDLYHQYVR